MRILKNILFSFLLIFVALLALNKNVYAEIDYTSELADYFEDSGIKEYTYNLYIKITGTSRVNHIEGRLHLENLDVENFITPKGFATSFSKDTLEYSLTSNKIYTASDGMLLYATITVRNIEPALRCRFEYEPITHNVVTTNTFTINKNAYKDGSIIKSVKAGEEFQYRITVRSANNVLATNDVVVTDTIPRELEILSASNSGIISGQKITWNLGSFSPGEREITLSVNVRAKTDSKGSIKNTAILTVGDNKFQDEEPTDILYSDITIEKKASRSIITKGEEFYYTILVKNVGTGTTKNVTLEDTLDPDLEFISSSIANTKTGNKLVFNLGTIEAGQTKTIRINVKAKNTTNKEIISNTAIAREDGKDPVQDSEDVKIIEEVILPDISISKRASVNEIRVGEEFSYIITIKNNNQLDLIDLELKDTLDNNLEFVFSDDEVETEGNTYKWLFDLKGNETKVIEFVVRVKNEVDSDKVLNTAILSFEDKEIPSEEIEIPIIPEDTPSVLPEEPKNEEIENPKTGNIVSTFIISLGIIISLVIVYYIKKNKKFYKI